MENTKHQTHRVMHPLKFRMLKVKNITPTSPLMRTVTLEGPDLTDFVSASADDHVKVFFPKPGEEKPIVPTVGPQGPVIPEGEDKPVMRDFTPVRWNQEAQELDLEFFLHEEGPAANWVKQAKVGDTLGVGGPRGSLVVPYDFDWYLMIGDEVAIPSFGRRLAELPAGSKALVFIEVSSHDEKREFKTSAQLEIHWIIRDKSEAGSAELFKKFILKSSFPHGDYFSWIAAELSCAQEIKELLETIRGANPDWIKSTGYWKKS